MNQKQEIRNEGGGGAGASQSENKERKSNWQAVAIAIAIAVVILGYMAWPQFVKYYHNCTDSPKTLFEKNKRL